MSEKLPYVPTYGVITRTLDKIKSAATPPRFTQDFLATKLGIKGGSAKPVIPFLKRAGFLATDGAPTDIYKRFRNPSGSGLAAAQALRTGYRPLFQMNEYAHELSDKDLKGLIVQATGAEPTSTMVKTTVGSFKALRAFADFGADVQEEGFREDQRERDRQGVGEEEPERPDRRFGLSYTINLNLPATSDIAVFDAIFKSLREHLLRKV